MEPIPYSKLDNPQSLNLYSYVGNDPESFADADGHEGQMQQFYSNLLKAGAWGAIYFLAGNGQMGGSALAAAAFGYESEKAQQQNQKPTAAPAPTTQYNGVPAAGIAAEQTYNPASKDLNREFNGNIYQNAQGQCCFIQTPNIGTESTSSPPSVSTLPSGSTRVATFHTHGANSHGAYDDEHFSPADKSNARARGVPIFVGTPGGVIREYNPHAFIFHRTITFKETAP